MLLKYIAAHFLEVDGKALVYTAHRGEQLLLCTIWKLWDINASTLHSELDSNQRSALQNKSNAKTREVQSIVLSYAVLSDAINLQKDCRHSILLISNNNPSQSAVHRLCVEKWTGKNFYSGQLCEPWRNTRQV